MEIPGSRKITFPQPVYGRKHIAARTWYSQYPLHRTEASENEEHQKQDYSDSQCIFSITTHIISVGAIDQIIDTALHDTERYNRQAKHSEQNIDQTIILGSYHIQLFGIFPETEYTPDTAGQKGQQQISDSCIIFSCTVIDITEYLYPGNQIVNAAGYNRQHDNTKYTSSSHTGTSLVV